MEASAGRDVGPVGSVKDAERARERSEGPDADHHARQDAAGEAHKRVADDIRDVCDRLKDLSRVWGKLAEAANSPSDLLHDLRDAVDRLIKIVDALVAAGVDQPPGRALGAVTTMSAVQDGIAEIQAGFEGTGTAGMARLVTAGQPVSKALAKSPASIMKTLNRAAKWSWALISQLLTPKEWSLTGGITLPGLSDASISVKFG